MFVDHQSCWKQWTLEHLILYVNKTELLKPKSTQTKWKSPKQLTFHPTSLRTLDIPGLTFNPSTAKRLPGVPTSEDSSLFLPHLQLQFGDEEEFCDELCHQQTAELVVQLDITCCFEHGSCVF